MKKVFVLILSVFVCVMLLTGCSRGFRHDPWNQEWNDTLGANWGTNRAPDDVVVEAGYRILQLNDGWFQALHGEWVYATDRVAGQAQRSLYRMRPDGTERQRVIPYSQFRGFAQSSYNDGWIYFLSEAPMSIWGNPGATLYRMRPDGSEMSALPTVSDVHLFRGSGEWIYYMAGNDVWHMNLYMIHIDGTRNRKLAPNITDFIMSDDYIFVLDEIVHSPELHRSKLLRFDLSGENRTVLIQYDAFMRPLFTCDAYLYFHAGFGGGWAGKSNELHRVSIDGTRHNVLVVYPEHRPDLTSFHNFNKTDGHIYFTATTSYRNHRTRTILYRIHLDGTNKTSILFNAAGYTVEAHGQHIYLLGWTAIRRMNLDGSELELVRQGGMGTPYSGHFVAKNQFVIAMRN